MTKISRSRFKSIGLTISVITIALLPIVVLSSHRSFLKPKSSSLSNWQAPVQISTSSGSPIITSVSCATSSFCVAVDSEGNVIYFSSGVWSTPSNIDPASLVSVSCVSTTFCIAVDASGDALTFNGSTWSSPFSVLKDTGFTSISCVTSSFCEAVDVIGEAVEWNGSFQTVGDIDGRQTLSAVSCVAGPFCVAVDTRGYAFTWVSGSWSSGNSAISNGDLTNVSCVSSTWCLAIGLRGNADIYNGSSWSNTTFDTSVNGAATLSCASSTFCFAGDSVGKIFEFNGTWKSPINLNPQGSQVRSLTCLSVTFCVAFDGNGNSYSFDGSKWSSAIKVESASRPLEAVSCISLVFCIAADKSGFVYELNGSNVIPFGDVSSGSEITSISCVSTNFCIAVDINGDAIEFNGTSWISPVNIDPTGFGLAGVSCAAVNVCVAVDNKGDTVSFDGSRWFTPFSIESTDALTSISCPSTSECVATSFNGNAYVLNSLGLVLSQYVLSSDLVGPMSISCANPDSCEAVDATGDAFSWDGSAWSNGVPVSTNPLVSVSCPVSTWCTAVDSNGNAYTYDGTSWSFQIFTGDSAGLTTISCVTPTFCVSGDINGGEVTYLGKPVVESVTPDSGPTVGGGTVSIIGSGFSNTLTVMFGGNLSSFKVLSDSSISAVVPPSSITGVVSVLITTQYGTSNPSATAGYLYVNAGGYFPIVPTRVCDTRANASDPSTYAGETLMPNSSLSVSVAGGLNSLVPSDASAVAANITAVGPTSNGYLTVFPTGMSQPNASVLNFLTGESAVATLVEIPVGANGSISIFNSSGNTDILVDIEGYYDSSAGNMFNPVSPFRIADTRTYSSNTYQDSNKVLGPNSTVNISFAGISGFSSATAVVINLTATDTSGVGGYLIAKPTGPSSPTASTLNYSASMTVANRAIVELGTSQSITVTNFNANCDAIVDVSGYFSSSGYAFHPVPPVRIVDTRSGSSSNYQLVGHYAYPGNIFSVQVSNYNQDSVPLNAVEVVATATVTDTNSNGGYIVFYPQGVSIPSSSDVNWSVFETVANLIVTGLSSTGTLNFVTENSGADVIVDVSGWYG